MFYNIIVVMLMSSSRLNSIRLSLIGYIISSRIKPTRISISKHNQSAISNTHNSVLNEKFI